MCGPVNTSLLDHMVDLLLGFEEPNILFSVKADSESQTQTEVVTSGILHHEVVIVHGVCYIFYASLEEQCLTVLNTK